MDHSELEQRMLELDDPGLAPGERAELEAHRAACPSCAARLELWRKTARALFKRPAPEGSEAFVRSVMRRLEAPEPAAVGVWAWLPAAPRWALAGCAAAAVVLVLSRAPWKPAAPAGGEPLAYASELLDETSGLADNDEEGLETGIEEYFL